MTGLDRDVREFVGVTDGGRVVEDDGSNGANQNDAGESTKAKLFNWRHPDDVEDDADVLTGKQLYHLKEGVRAAIENDDAILGAPGDLTTSRWNHAGIGVSVYMHASGVVVLKNGDGAIVTDADTLEHMSLARARFFANPGPATVTSDEVDE